MAALKAAVEPLRELSVVGCEVELRGRVRM
jgi:hypothetical protein